MCYPPSTMQQHYSQCLACDHMQVWQKVSMWRAVHEMCNDAFEGVKRAHVLQ